MNRFFDGLEASTRTVTLNTGVNRPDDFVLFFDWLFLDDYKPHVDFTPDRRLTPDRNDVSLTHARVYILAERPCVDSLKQLAVGKMTEYLRTMYAFRSNAGDGATVVPTLKASTIVELVKTVYPHTTAQRLHSGSRSDDVGEASGAGFTSDPMRTVIASHAGSGIRILRLDAGIAGLLKGYEGCEDFPCDLIFNVKCGDKLEYP